MVEVEKKQSYKNIKWILKTHIKKGVKSLWTWKGNNFTCIYKNYSGKDRIYTCEQLLKLLE